MTVFISSSRRQTREYTDELRNSYVHLIQVTEEDGMKTFTLKWFVNTSALMHGVNYTSHYIRFGDAVHRLRIVRHATRLMETKDRRLVYLLLGLTPAVDESAQVSFSILGPADVEIQPQENTPRLVGNLPDRGCYVEFLECPTFMSLNLTVLCRIAVKCEGPESSEVAIEKRNSLVPHLGRLLESEEYSDVTVEVDGREFRVHRAILAVRSPVFRAMFRNEMRERSENRLVIRDSDSGAFQELLRYLYTGKTCPLTTERALSLMSLADKYNIQDLLSDLEEFLYLNIRVENVASTLFKADAHNVGALKRGAVSFIAEHLREVMNSRDWVRLRDRADLMEEVLRYFV